MYIHVNRLPIITQYNNNINNKQKTKQKQSKQVELYIIIIIIYIFLIYWEQYHRDCKTQRYLLKMI